MVPPFIYLLVCLWTVACLSFKLIKLKVKNVKLHIWTEVIHIISRSQGHCENSLNVGGSSGVRYIEQQSSWARGADVKRWLWS